MLITGGKLSNISSKNLALQRLSRKIRDSMSRRVGNKITFYPKNIRNSDALFKKIEHKAGILGREVQDLGKEYGLKSHGQAVNNNNNNINNNNNNNNNNNPEEEDDLDFSQNSVWSTSSEDHDLQPPQTESYAAPDTTQPMMNCQEIRDTDYADAALSGQERDPGDDE